MIKVEVVGIDGAVAKLTAMPQSVKKKLGLAIAMLSIEAVGEAKRKLSGPVLQARTGVLRGSVNYRLVKSKGSVVGVVGTNVSYAGVHEYGFNGAVTVKSHMRRSKAQMRSARYKVRDKSGHMVTKFRQTGKFGREVASVPVREHSRHMAIPERSYLRSTLREMSSKIRSEIVGAVREGLKNES